MPIDTLCTDYALTHATDATDATFPSKIPTVTEPTGDGVIDLGGRPSVPNGLRLLPIGTGANNAVLTGMRVIGWSPLKVPNKKTLWIPCLLVEIAAVFGNVTGVASVSAALGSTYFFMDTITLVTGNANVSHEIVTNAGDIIAHLVVDVKGCQKAEITFDLGASATAANCVYGKI